MIGNLRVGLNALALLPHFSPAMPYRFTRRRESRRRIEPDARYEHARSSFGALTVLSADDLLVEDMPGEPGRAGSVAFASRSSAMRSYSSVSMS